MEQENEAKKKIHLKSKKDKSFNYSYTHLLILFFVIFISFPFITNNKSLIHENYLSEITLKIKGKGTQNIINQIAKPDIIYLNEKKINFTKDNGFVTIENIEKEENTVRQYGINLMDI